MKALHTQALYMEALCMEARLANNQSINLTTLLLD